MVIKFQLIAYKLQYISTSNLSVFWMVPIFLFAELFSTFLLKHSRLYENLPKNVLYRYSYMFFLNL